MEKNHYFLDRTWSMEVLGIYKFAVESWAVSRQLVQGFNQYGVLPLPISFYNLPNSSQLQWAVIQVQCILAFFLKERQATSVSRESCMMSELLEIFLIGHFSTDTNFYVVPR